MRGGPQKQRDRILFDVPLVEPSTPLERSLVEILKELLCADRVGIRDDFFDLGGDSVLAVQAVARIRQQLEVEVAGRVLFDDPTVERLARRIEPLLGAKERSTPARIVRVPRGGPLRASFAQEDHWLFDQIQGSDPVTANVRLRGPLDEGALRRATADIVARHDVLRTTLAYSDDEGLTQVVSASARLVIPLVDLRAVERDRREETLGARLTEHAQIPFDLRHGPLLSVTIFRLSDDEHVISLTAHHAIFDGWSTTIFLGELAELYDAHVRGTARPLGSPSVQYADYAAWHRARVEGEILDRDTAFWTTKLSGAPYATFPSDRPRPPERARRGAMLELAFGSELSKALVKRARSEGTTLYVVLLGALNALLSRYSGLSDVVVGTTIANRPSVETESLIGPFVNALALRTDLSGAPTVRELLQRTSRTALEAREHQEMPFSRLVRELRLPRDPSRTPLFQVMFILLTPDQSFSIGESSLEWVAAERGVAPFDVQISAKEQLDRIVLSVEYSTALFDRSTIDRIMAHYVRLLAAMVELPDSRLDDLALLDEQQQREAIVEWNATEVAFPGSAWIHETVEAQAARTPGAVAVVFGTTRVTYEELDTRANQLAHALRRQGVGPDILVGVCLQRSVDLVVALLAVLKAGGAYVPIEPSFPMDRLRAVIEEAAPLVVLTATSSCAALPPGVDALSVDDPARWWVDAPKTKPDVRPRPQNLAYVVFTSGSTGRPKGTPNTHAGIRNRLLWMQDALRIDSSDAVVQKTPFGFDVSVWEFFWPLMYGARLVVAAPGGQRDLDYLVDLVRDEAVTTIHFVPTLLNAFLEHPGVGSCTALRRVICSGEALSHALKERCLERLGIELYNLYGPSEAAVDVSWWRAVPGGYVVPIGRPIANTQLYVLDASRTPAPVGVPGELHIGGVQLARGYLGMPALTAARFVPDPFGPPGSRLYRTGDLTSYRADGTIDFIGRVDDQVKIRGFRIELGDIEAAVLTCPGVRETAVVVREGVSGDPLIVAYVTPAVGASFSPHSLREALRRKLPEHMIPNTFVSIDALPLTQSGKLDRKALPTPSVTPSEGHLPPRTATEQRIAALWCELFNRAQVGLHDNFFALGGHSMLALRFLARLRADGIRVPLRTLFDAPTVEAFARQLAGAPREIAERRVPKASSEVSFPLSPNQSQMWHWQLRHPRNHTRNIVMSYRLTGRLEVSALSRAVDDELRRHEAFRTTFAVTTEGPVQVVRPQPCDALRRLDWSDTPSADCDKRVDDFVTAEWLRPVTLANGEVTRVILIRFAEDLHVLLLATHHIAIEQPFCQTFFNGVFASYGAFVRGRTSPVADPTLQYRDYSAWRLNLLRTPALLRQIELAKDRARGTPPLRLPFDHVPPPERTAGRVTARVRITDSTVRRMEALAGEESVTGFVILAAVFGIFLSRVTAQQDVLFLALSSLDQTKAPELASIVGCFSDVLPLRIDLRGAPTFRDVVRQVGKLVLELNEGDAIPSSMVFEDPAVFDDARARALLNVVEEWPAVPERAGELELAPSAGRFGPRAVETVWHVLVRARESSLMLSSDTFNQSTADRLADELTRLIESGLS